MWHKSGRKIITSHCNTTLDILSDEEATHIQRIVGSFLYYARAVDNTILTAVNEIAATQAAPTKKTKDATNLLMDYLYTHPSAKIQYTASDM